MFSPSYLEGIPIPLEKAFRELEIRIMEDIVRRLKNNAGEIIRSADWLIYRLHELGESKEAIREYIKDALNLSEKELEKIYSGPLSEGYANDEALYKAVGKDFIRFEDNEPLQQLIRAIIKQTNSAFKNITQSLGFAVNKNGVTSFTPLADFYQQTLDGAVLDIASGAFDYNTVLKRTVKELTNSGLRTVDYASGHSNRVPVAARRAVMTGFNQTVARINDYNAKELETDTFEVTWHSGHRPSHWWGGGWYTKQELESVCGLGSVDGLCGANCYHNYYPVIPGVSVPTYSAEELEQMRADELKTTEYDGKEYTKYEALQRQRRLETKMRAQRQEINLLKEGGADEDDIIAARCRYRGTSAEYVRFSNAMGIPQQRERVTVDGLGNIGVGKWKIQGDKAQAPFPKGFKDNRKVGKIISQEQLDTFAKKAESYGVKLGIGKPGTYGGFERYKGDPRVLDEALEHIKNNQPVLTKISGDDKVILQYGDVIDSSGRVDVGAFAMTRGRTITLNRFMYDDTDYLIKEYADSVNTGHFVQGTDYRNIIDHEVGHVFVHQRKSLLNRLREACRRKALIEHISTSEYIIANISIYAERLNELPAELNSMFNSNNYKLAFELFKEVGLI